MAVGSFVELMTTALLVDISDTSVGVLLKLGVCDRPVAKPLAASFAC